MSRNSSKPPKEPGCGFCHHGREVEDICGPLYTAPECTAHKKCMQYSALLVQYRTKGFGGFKKHKVIEEIKRGRGLACTVCKKKVSKKKVPPKGATCGCAISHCRRTFHFYCAYQDTSCITRRIEVRNKATSQVTVCYRIFCSPEHQAKFEKLQNDEMEIAYNSDSSATEYSSDEDGDEDDTPEKKRSAKSQQRAPASPQPTSAKPRPASPNTRPASPKSQLASSKTRPASPKPRPASPKPRPASPKTRPASPKPRPASPRRETDSPQPSRSPRASLVNMEAPSAQSRKDENDASSEKGSKRPQSPAGGKSSKKVKADDAEETFVLPSGDDMNSNTSPRHNLMPERLPSPILSANNDISQPDIAKSGADFILCIMEDGTLLDKYGDMIRSMVSTQNNVPESAIHFLYNQGLPLQLSPHHMLYFMKDVAKAVYESNTELLARLLLKPRQSDVDKYTQHVHLQEDVMDVELHSLMQERIRDVIGQYFLQKSKELGVDVGSGFILAELNSMFITLPLSNQMDPNQDIRRGLPGQRLVYPLEISARLMDPRRQQGASEESHKANRDKELMSLCLWLQREADESFKVRVRPKEIILRDSNSSSTTCHMCNHFQRRSNVRSGAPTSVAMFIVPVNGQVMAYAAYCRLAIGAFVKEELTALTPIYCVLDVDDLEGFSRVEDILPALPNNIVVQAYGGLNPAESAISCVVLKFSLSTAA